MDQNDRDAIVIPDGSGDRTEAGMDSGEPGCSYAIAPPSDCYVPNPSRPAAPVVRCARTPRVIPEVMDISAVRWRNGMLYWLAGRNIVRLNGATTEAFTTSADIGYFDVDDDAVYYAIADDAGSSTIRRTALDRSGTVTLASNTDGRFVLDADRIYFETADGRFVSTAKSGGGAIDPVAAPSSIDQIVTNSGVLLDATHFYWNEGAAPNVTLRRVAKGSANVETVGTSLPGVAVLLQGDSVLLVAEGKHILEMPKSGGCPHWLADGWAPIAADDKSIYWASSFSSDTSDLLLYRAPRQGGVTIEVMVGSSGIRGAHVPLLTPTQAFLSAENTSFMPHVWVFDRP